VTKNIGTFWNQRKIGMIKQQVEFMFGMSLNEPDKYFQSKTTNPLQFSGFEQTGIDCNFHGKKKPRAGVAI
jgi:hypothetical protein